MMLTSHSEEETKALAQRLGSHLQAGHVLGLSGNLGAGKTCFIQGLARGLGVEEKAYVRSPSFGLIHRYPGRIPLIHADLYRLENESELIDIGWADILDEPAIIAVEWYDRFNINIASPEQLLKIHIEVKNPTQRHINFNPSSHIWDSILTRIT